MSWVSERVITFFHSATSLALSNRMYQVRLGTILHVDEVSFSPNFPILVVSSLSKSEHE